MNTIVLRLFLALSATHYVQAFEPCVTKMKNMAIYEWAQELGQPVTNIAIISSFSGAWTRMGANDYGSYFFDLEFESKRADFTVDAQQIGSSSDCLMRSVSKGAEVSYDLANKNLQITYNNSSTVFCRDVERHSIPYVWGENKTKTENKFRGPLLLRMIRCATTGGSPDWSNASIDVDEQGRVFVDIKVWRKTDMPELLELVESHGGSNVGLTHDDSGRAWVHPEALMVLVDNKRVFWVKLANP